MGQFNIPQGIIVLGGANTAAANPQFNSIGLGVAASGVVGSITAVGDLTLNGGSGNSKVILTSTGTGFIAAASGLRVTAANTPTFTGLTGIELEPQPGSTKNIIRSYDRTNSVYRRLDLEALLVNINNSAKVFMGYATTPTDNSNGILQLATATASTGGIGFGSDLMIYRSAAGTLTLDGSGTDNGFQVWNNGVRRFNIEANANTDVRLAAITAPLALYSNNALALTLDNSQNATFAGNITKSAASAFNISSASGQNLGLFASGAASISMVTNGTVAVTVNSNQSVTFAADINAPSSPVGGAIGPFTYNGNTLGMNSACIISTAASSTGRAGLRLPSGAAPTSPVSGDFWYDGTNLKFRDGGTTRTITWV